jgi:hypothetical protein
MSRLTNEEKAIAAILKAVSDINLDPGYLAMYLNQQLGPAKRVLDEVLYEAGYYRIGEEPETTEANDDSSDDSVWGIPEELADTPTPFEVKAAILGNLWLNYRDEPVFSDFIEYNDLGLPLAYCFDSKVVLLNEQSARFVEEAFRLLLTVMEIEEDPGYSSEDAFLEDLHPWLEDNNFNPEEELEEYEDGESEGSEDDEDSYDSHEDPDYEEPNEEELSDKEEPKSN